MVTHTCRWALCASALTEALLHPGEDRSEILAGRIEQELLHLDSALQDDGLDIYITADRTTDEAVMCHRAVECPLVKRVLAAQGCRQLAGPCLAMEESE